MCPSASNCAISAKKHAPMTAVCGRFSSEAGVEIPVFGIGFIAKMPSAASLEIQKECQKEATNYVYEQT